MSKLNHESNVFANYHGNYNPLSNKNIKTSKELDLIANSDKEEEFVPIITLLYAGESASELFYLLDMAILYTNVKLVTHILSLEGIDQSAYLQTLFKDIAYKINHYTDKGKYSNCESFYDKAKSQKIVEILNIFKEHGIYPNTDTLREIKVIAKEFNEEARYIVYKEFDFFTPRISAIFNYNGYKHHSYRDGIFPDTLELYNSVKDNKAFGLIDERYNKGDIGAVFFMLETAIKLGNINVIKHILTEDEIIHNRYLKNELIQEMHLYLQDNIIKENNVETNKQIASILRLHGLCVNKITLEKITALEIPQPIEQPLEPHQDNATIHDFLSGEYKEDIID